MHQLARIIAKGCIVGLLGAHAEAGGILYVDDDGPPDGDGLSWVTAFRFLDDATERSLDPDNGIVEIRVAGGLYRPGFTEAHHDGPVFPGNTFDLADGVALRGGYAGIGAPDPDVRDIQQYASILDGDTNEPGNEQDNVWHVLAGYFILEAEIDGFTIQGGNARNQSSVEDDEGGGVLLYYSTANIRDCTFTGNRAVGSGGAIAVFSGGGMVLDTTFIANTAAQGGGMWVDSFETLLKRCRFIGNSATGRGGGIFNDNVLTVHECSFFANQAVEEGGGMAVRTGVLELVNSIFTGNQATVGGGLASLTSSDALDGYVRNCTFSANLANDRGGGVYHDDQAFGMPRLRNCVLWNNVDSSGTGQAAQVQVAYGPGALHVSFSCVEGLSGGLSGPGNIGGEPGLVDADGPDGIAGTIDDDLRLSPGSPCIDAAANADVPPDVLTDLDGQPRFADALATPDCPQAPGLCGDAPVVDMGAYEFQPCPWDLDGDGTVGVSDLLLLIASFGPCADCPADFNDDGLVSVLDLLDLIGKLGPCPGSSCVWDVNGDGVVDQADADQVVQNMGPCDGCPEDINGDGVVNGQDVAAVATHFGPCP